MTEDARPPVVHAPCGDIRGFYDQLPGADGARIVRAAGIPYATAGRFEPPVPLDSLAGQSPYPGDAPTAPGEVFEATRFSPMCPQNEDAAITAMVGVQRRDLGMSEDCLRLTVSAPADLAPGESLPVMVWIHGGSYVSGAGDSSVSDPVLIVGEQRVVLVTVTYRLGLFGYLARAHSPANLGLMDQAAAFTWVRRNIAAFGGDPGRVTAFGESAGADSIAHLMAAMGADASAYAEGAGGELLFDRAILLSPPLGIRRGRARMSAVMSRLASAKLSEDASMMEVLTLQEEVGRAVAFWGLPGMMPFGTEYGHAPLPPEHEVEEAWAAIAPRVPLLAVSVGTETTFFAHTMPAAQRLRSLPAVGEGAYWRLNTALSERVFTRAITRFAEDHARAGGEAHRAYIPFSVPGNPIASPHAIDVSLMSAREDTWHEVESFRGATWEEVEAAGRDLRRYLADFARGSGRGEGERGMLTKHPRVIRGHRVLA